MRKRYNTPHRSRVVKTRMTEEEYAEFAERLSAYNMSQAEFIRQAITGAAIHIVVQVAQMFKDGGAGLRLSQLIADVLKGNALGECASVNAAHTVRVDGLIRDGGLCRAGLAVTLVLADNGINFFFLGAGELFGLFGFAGYRFSGQWPLPPVPFGIAAQGRRKRCWSDRAFPLDE